jgi:hypothetical protein
VYRAPLRAVLPAAETAERHAQRAHFFDTFLGLTVLTPAGLLALKE